MCQRAARLPEIGGDPGGGDQIDGEPPEEGGDAGEMGGALRAIDTELAGVRARVGCTAEGDVVALERLAGRGDEEVLRPEVAGAAGGGDPFGRMALEVMDHGMGLLQMRPGPGDGGGHGGGGADARRGAVQRDGDEGVAQFAPAVIVVMQDRIEPASGDIGIGGEGEGRIDMGAERVDLGCRGRLCCRLFGAWVGSWAVWRRVARRLMKQATWSKWRAMDAATGWVSKVRPGR